MKELRIICSRRSLSAQPTRKVPCKNRAARIVSYLSGLAINISNWILPSNVFFNITADIFL